MSAFPNSACHCLVHGYIPASKVRQSGASRRETFLLQRLDNAVLHADSLCTAALELLHSEVIPDHVFIDVMPSVMGNLYLDSLRISALLTCLEELSLSPETVAVIESLIPFCEKIGDVQAELDNIFQQACDSSADDPDESDASSTAGEEESGVDPSPVCTLAMTFSDDVDEKAAERICAQVTGYAQGLLDNYFADEPGDLI